MIPKPEDSPDAIARLVEAAKIDGLPDDVFLSVMTPRKLRELSYRVVAQIQSPDLALELEVHGSGTMRAHVTMPSIHFEDGEIVLQQARQQLQWAEDGTPVVLTTKLDHRHLKKQPNAAQVMRAFVDTIGVRKEASCPGGYQAWCTMMQLFADRIAREQGKPIEIIALPPLPPRQYVDQPERGKTIFEVNAVSDNDTPDPIDGYADQLEEMDAHMAPNAMSLLLLPPGLLVRQQHREIFQSG